MGPLPYLIYRERPFTYDHSVQNQFNPQRQLVSGF